MKKIVHTLALMFIPILLSSCSTGKSNSLSEQDLDTVSFFCNDYSNFSNENTSSVLAMESDYLSNVAILNEKYPDSLELKQLGLSVELAFEYADWVGTVENWKTLPFSITTSDNEDIETTLGNSPPTPASAVTEGLTKSCKPFKD